MYAVVAKGAPKTYAWTPASDHPFTRLVHTVPVESRLINCSFLIRKVVVPMTTEKVSSWSQGTVQLREVLSSVIFEPVILLTVNLLSVSSQTPQEWTNRTPMPHP